MSWRESIMSLLLLAAALFLWQLLKEEEPKTVVETNPQEVLPGYYLNDAELTRFNQNGNAQYTITANKIEQNPNTNILTLSDINIEYHEQSNWLIKADKAILPANRESINFTGNVIASQNVSANNIRFSSENLKYNIKLQQLSTSDRIQAKRGAQVITAKGMRLDMQNERVQLLSQVKIRFLP